VLTAEGTLLAEHARVTFAAPTLALLDPRLALKQFALTSSPARLGLGQTG